ncbi:hypothetical protein Hamer_G000949 [Homarus americanus]|uniref:CCHC-type domain-containing protein n=1 Tax=Homarus americanus TaxID=6706 RepID=A0A8J5N2G9_HOMAM|nr:hypothetical protein Hamer_G000949 [Homarus americanus]
MSLSRTLVISFVAKHAVNRSVLVWRDVRPVSMYDVAAFASSNPSIEEVSELNAHELGLICEYYGVVISSSASKVKLFNAVGSQLFGDNVDVGLREDHGEASQVNVAESRSVNHELRLLESQIKLKEAEAKAKEVGIRQAEAEAKAKKAEAIAKEVGIRQAEADSKNLRLRIQLGQSNPSITDGLTPRSKEFFRTINEEVSTYLLDRKFSTIEEAAKHADGFVLRHGRTNNDVMPPQVQRTFNPSLHRARQGNTNNGNFVRNSFVRDRRSWTRSPPNGASKFSTYTCSFCGKPGHKVEFCCTRLQPNTGKPAMIVTAEANTSPVGGMAGMSKADSMPIALVSTKGEARESAVSVLASRDFDLFQESFVKDPDLGTFRPFLSQGTVEVDGVETPVTILRDSGCLQTLIKEGIANVACMHELPVAGVDLIFGNDLAGGQIGNVTPPPVLRERPESTAELQQLEDDMPGVFRLCAETRSMSMTNDHNVTPDVDD